MLRTDVCQSAADYRFLATVMGIYPLFPICEGSLFENQTTHFVVFEPNLDHVQVSRGAARVFWVCLWFAPWSQANM
jgi:hypothetical protein